MATEPLFDELDWFDDREPRSPAMNMAIDEVLLSAFAGADEAVRPVLRTYLWERPAVSIGYFDAVADARTRFPGVPLVRRWTGGGNVEHGLDFTYSLLVPRQRIPASWQGAGAYQAIHAVVASVLRDCGLARAVLNDASVQSGAESARECFRQPVDHDVMIGARKVAGGAQRRTRLGLLHQGSVQDGHGSFGPAGTARRMVQEKLPRTLAQRCARRPLSEEEFATATRLSASRYNDASWTDKF